MDSEIISFVKLNENTTCNQISKHMGFTKSNSRVADALTKLVENGKLLVDTSARYLAYKIAPTAQPTITKATTTGQVTEEALVGFVTSNPDLSCNKISQNFGFAKTNKRIKNMLDGNAGISSKVKGGVTVYGIVDAPTQITVDKAPALKTEELYGYSISRNADGGHTITSDTGEEMSINSGEYLLIINGTPKYAIETAKDAFAAIEQYAKYNDFSSYVMKNVSTGNVIESPSDIKEDVIINIDVEKHNKAAK